MLRFVSKIVRHLNDETTGGLRKLWRKALT